MRGFITAFLSTTELLNPSTSLPCFPNHLFHLCDFVMRRWAIFSISLVLAISAYAQQPPKSPPEPPGAGTVPSPSPTLAPNPGNQVCFTPTLAGLHILQLEVTNSCMAVSTTPAQETILVRAQ